MKGQRQERIARRTEKNLAADESVGGLLWPHRASLESLVRSLAWHVNVDLEGRARTL